MTLIETLVGVCLLGLVMGAASLAFAGALNVNTVSMEMLRTTQRITGEMYQAGEKFGPDMDGANAVYSTGVGGLPRCRANASDTVVVDLVGQQINGQAIATTVVSYSRRVVSDGSGSTVELWRNTCATAAPYSAATDHLTPAESGQTLIAGELPLLSQESANPAVTCFAGGSQTSRACDGSSVIQLAKLRIDFGYENFVAEIPGTRRSS